MNDLETHALYRFFDDHGELLYVGITNNPGRRWTEHEKSKPWWHEVSRVELERHAGRAAVLLAESVAIKTERPRYNIQQAVAVAVATASTEVHWVRCDRCSAEAELFSIIDAEIRRYRKFQDHQDDPRVPLRDKILDGSDLLDVPSPAPWHLTCDEHYPGDDVVSYWGRLNLGRRAGVDLIRHLGEKRWVNQYTQLDELAVRILAPAEAALPRGVAW